MVFQNRTSGTVGVRYFTDWMLFQSPNPKCHGTEVIKGGRTVVNININIIIIVVVNIVLWRRCVSEAVRMPF